MSGKNGDFWRMQFLGGALYVARDHRNSGIYTLS